MDNQEVALRKIADALSERLNGEFKKIQREFEAQTDYINELEKRVLALEKRRK